MPPSEATPPIYTHTQAGWFIPSITAGSVILALTAMAVAHFPVTKYVVVALGIAFSISLIVMLPFSRLRIEIHDDVLTWAFRFGFARGSVLLSTIDSVSVVRNPWYYGYGIRITPHGRLYNVSGNSAVEIGTGGKRFRLGTDEPERLADALKAATRRPTNG